MAICTKWTSLSNIWLDSIFCVLICSCIQFDSPPIFFLQIWLDTNSNTFPQIFNKFERAKLSCKCPMLHLFYPFIFPIPKAINITHWHIHKSGNTYLHFTNKMQIWILSASLCLSVCLFICPSTNFKSVYIFVF